MQCWKYNNYLCTCIWLCGQSHVQGLDLSTLFSKGLLIYAAV